MLSFHIAAFLYYVYHGSIGPIIIIPSTRTPVHAIIIAVIYVMHIK